MVLQIFENLMACACDRVKCVDFFGIITQLHNSAMPAQRQFFELGS
jgi:hypothetical protein